MKILLAAYADGRRGRQASRAGIERGLQQLLVSPRVPVPRRASRASRSPAPSYRVSDIELASRLSFFLWSSVPDDELLDLRRAKGQLKARRPRAAGPADARRSRARRR